MVYSTCSLEAEENERMVEAWSITHPDFELADTVISIPPDSATDGAFAARLTRRA
jgi:16S rRNA C967 or C1407 C5-methylase (RsmB/RsmF family)